MDILFVLCLFNADFSCQAYNLPLGRKNFCYICQFCLVSTVIKWSNSYLFNSSDPHSKCLFVVVHGKKVFRPFSVFRRSVTENFFLLGYDQARIYARAPGARAQGGKFSGAAY